jgi:hypothetical protein
MFRAAEAGTPGTPANKRHMLRVWAARVGAVLALVVQVAASAAQPVGSHTFTVMATRSATSVVTLTHAVSLDVTSGLTSSKVRVSGRGRIIGLALRPAAPSHAMPALVVAELQACYHPNCVGRYHEQFLSGSLITKPGLVVVPAGRYVLQAFTDGSPVTVTLQLHGLDRNVVLRPTVPTAYTVDSPPPTLPAAAPVAPGVTVAAAHHTIRQPGIEAFVFGQIDWKAAVGGDLTACFYNANIPVVLPECPGGTGIVADGVLVDPTAGTQLLYADYASSADIGPATGGLALAHASAATFIASNVAWLES